MLAPLSRFSGLEPSVVRPHHRITASLRDAEARVSCGLESKCSTSTAVNPSLTVPVPTSLFLVGDNMALALSKA
jgi:hypothetical protein